MEKLYGFKEKDIELLAKEIKNKGSKTLTAIFDEFSLKTGKAKGTVRNMYYALAKKTNEDLNFCKKYFEKPLKVGKMENFDIEQEKELVRKILISKNNGNSVRSTITSLANGDSKLALRYQNKFRNVLRKNSQLVSEIMLDINAKNHIKPVEPDKISQVQFARLKREIDCLVDRISAKYKKENLYLKRKLSILEAENIRLNTLLFGSGQGSSNSVKFFFNKKDNDMLN